MLLQYESVSTVVGERRCSRGLRLRSLLSLPEHDVMMCNTEYLTQPPLDKQNRHPKVLGGSGHPAKKHSQVRRTRGGPRGARRGATGRGRICYAPTNVIPYHNGKRSRYLTFPRVSSSAERRDLASARERKLGQFFPLRGLDCLLPKFTWTCAGTCCRASMHLIDYVSHCCSMVSRRGSAFARSSAGRGAKGAGDPAFSRAIRCHLARGHRSSGGKYLVEPACPTNTSLPAFAACGWA